MPHISAWQVATVPIICLAIGFFVWWIRINTGPVFFWLLAPVLNPETRLLSLARLLLAGQIVAMIYATWTKPDTVMHMGIPYSIYLCVLMLICFSDVLTTKASQGIIGLIARRVGFPGSPAGAEGGADAGPSDPEPTPKVPDDLPDPAPPALQGAAG